MELRSTCLKEKPVLVAVYVEKPIKRRSSKTNKNHHQRRLRICLSNNGGGYNRKADIIRYSHRLRESAKSTGTSSSPDPLKSIAVLVTEQLPCPQIIPSRENKKVKHQVCFDWIPMLKFNDKTKKKKNITQSFLYKVMAALRRFV